MNSAAVRALLSLAATSSAQFSSPITFVDAFAPSAVVSARRAVVGKPPSSSASTTRREMCGLIAVVADFENKKSANGDGSVDIDLPLLPDIVENTKRIRHRGPDGWDVLNCEDGGKSFRMGHTRLAIVDPTHAGDQPFSFRFSKGAEGSYNEEKKSGSSHIGHFNGPSSDGEEKKTTSYHLVANGEIYNHRSLYDDLQTNHGWDGARISESDCEIIAHAYAVHGPDCASKLDGMFAFVVVERDDDTGDVVGVCAARDPAGIKPLYLGKNKETGAYVFASELKGLVGLAEPASVVAVPPGHRWTPEKGLECYYNPDWLRKEDYAPWSDPDVAQPTDDDILASFRKAIEKRMMADVTYGFFLSGGIDSAVVAHDLLPLYVEEQLAKCGGDMSKFEPIHTYTVGMEDSPDVVAARAVVESLGGAKYIDHHVRTFTPDEVFDLIPEIVYHMETYEAELIRSSIPNWLLAERAAKDVKMVLTGEGSDELFAGYLYFQDARSPEEIQTELRRIYSMLGNINLHRTDRMTMAHGLEARVPFLDTEFTRLVMSVDPARKTVDKEAVRTNSRGREKTYLRDLFDRPNSMGDSLPQPVLWRAKAMQCEGVGEDWVSILQNKISGLVTDEEMANAAEKYPSNTPQTKEELYYRKIFDGHYHGMEHVVKLWEGGGRAMGAAWKSDMYTREGLRDTNVLSHSLQKKSAPAEAPETEVVLT